MSRPFNEVPADSEFQSAHTIRTRLGISEGKVRSMALAGLVEVRSTTAVINLYRVADVEKELGKPREYKQVRINSAK